MSANMIVERVFDFLKTYPPFSMIDSGELRSLSATLSIRFFSKEEQIFAAGEAPPDHFYLVRQGKVDLIRPEAEKQHLVDVCGEGDIFGARAILSGGAYALSAICREECLIYQIPKASFDPILTSNSEVALYFAAGFASGSLNDRANMEKTQVGFSALSRRSKGEVFYRMQDVLTLSGEKSIVSCSADTSIREAAQQMTAAGVGSIVVVDEQQHPLGICTDTDFRKKVLAADLSSGGPISEIMSSPVVTSSPNRKVVELTLFMLSKGIKHLVITPSGRADSPVMGMISEHDLLLNQANNPGVLIRQINQSKQVDELADIRNKAEALLRNYLREEASISFISRVMSAINEALIEKAIRMAEFELAVRRIPSPELAFCWLNLGSEGRSEQLLRTDLDNALVYENPSKGKEKEAHAYFLELGKHVIETLHACGFSRCPADIMASNPEWCQSLKQWKQYFSQWIRQPEPKSVMFSTIFLDLKAVFGKEEIAKSLKAHIVSEVKKEPLFIQHLAANSLQNPAPLGFFRNLLIEKSGENKDTFDIKLRAMMPLVDSARLLCLSHYQIDKSSTLDRYELLAELEPQKKALYLEAKMAYELMMRFRAISGLKNQNSGRFLEIKELNKLERQALRNAFGPISDLQESIKLRFKTDLFGG
ncbi:MAG: DUF294 nucleotidyltransferase-like domain-containing protein [Cyclobacteriaceae bacterium]|nr:cyclic nucleotide-binding domain-containing protein [Cyclobacteriaceae bacterium]MCH8515872.1 DUF294 nucleotidyltransferase-like domain-containing protein [Cyclobacteriaceae bacterium]